MSVESEMEVAGGGSPRDDVPLLPLILEDSGGDRMAAATWLELASCLLSGGGGGVAFLLHDYRCWRVRAILHSLRPGVNTGLICMHAPWELLIVLMMVAILTWRGMHARSIVTHCKL